MSVYCPTCKAFTRIGCFKANCPIANNKIEEVKPQSGAEKVKRLIDKGDITMDDIIQYINDDPKGQYQVIDLWEDD